MKVIGLTGNIGTGKSTVSKMFEKLGAKIIDADKIARDVVEPGQPALKELVSVFGDEILNSEKKLDREFVAGIVFNNVDNREKLNRIIHPRILVEINKRIDTYRAENAEFVIIEAALLIEKAGLIKLVDKLIVVSVDKNTQIQRIKDRDNLSTNEIKLRIGSQMANEEKIKLADYIIDNSHGREKTEQKVKNIWESLI